MLDVYKRAAWKHTTDSPSKLSSIDNCIPYALSGLTLGSISKSEDRTKKFPWNECTATPLVQRNLKRASNPILRDR